MPLVLRCWSSSLSGEAMPIVSLSVDAAKAGLQVSLPDGGANELVLDASSELLDEDLSLSRSRASATVEDLRIGGIVTSPRRLRDGC